MSDLVLRPRSATELIDAAFQVYRRAPVPFIVAMALVYVPWLAIRLLLQIEIPQTPDQFTPTMFRDLMIFAAAGIVIYGLAGGVVSLIARAVYLDEPIDVPDAFRQTLTRILPITVATAITFALIGIGFVFLLIPGILLIGRFFAVRQIVVLESQGPFAAIVRSGHLATRNYGRIIGTLFLVAVLTWVVNVGAALLINLQPSKVVANVFATLVTILIYPILGITETMLYFDTRIRNEGFDVEYLAGKVTDTATTAGPVS
jgi:hypothetical protein